MVVGLVVGVIRCFLSVCQGIARRSLQKSAMMEAWMSYQSRVEYAEAKLKQEQERLGKHQEDLEANKVSLAEKLTAAEDAEARVKEHLRTMRQERTGES